MDKIVIIGSNGMLGYALWEYYQKMGHNVVPLTRDDFEIGKDPIEILEKKIENSQIIINCAGMIKPRISKNPIEETLIVNSQFPKNLAKLALKYTIKLIHITTDCVYSGSKGNYDELDYFDAKDIYGLSKTAGDVLNCMTLRTSIIGEEIKNKYSLLEWVKSQKNSTINGFTNHKWNGVTTVYLAEIIEKIIFNNLYKHGIFHIHSKEVVSKFELVTLINEIYDLNLRIVKDGTNKAVDRSLSSIHPISKEVVQKSIRTQIEEMHGFFKSIK